MTQVRSTGSTVTDAAHPASPSPNLPEEQKKPRTNPGLFLFRRRSEIMTRVACRAAEKDPLKEGAVAVDIAAGGCAVPADVPSVQGDVGFPGERVHRGGAAQVATGAGRPAVLDPFQVGTMADDVAAGRRAVLPDVAGVVVERRVGIRFGPGKRVHRCDSAKMATRTGRSGAAGPVEFGPVAEGVGASVGAVGGDVGLMLDGSQLPPVEGVNRFLIAEVALGAGDLGDASREIPPVTFGTRLDLGLRRGLVSVRQPCGRVLTAVGAERNL